METEVLGEENKSHFHVFIIQVTWTVLGSNKSLLLERPAAEKHEP
jgi:hypothetical protein